MKLSATQCIPGPAGQIEVLSQAPDGQVATATAIICHPNPLHGGTMHNKVVTTIHQAMHHLSLRTVRFNYRGVGRSEGVYGDTVGEQQDLATVIAWVQQQWPETIIWLAGFSFGTYISAAVQHQTQVATQLISVAPAVDRYDYQSLTRIDCPWWVVATDADEVVPFSAVEPWLANPPSPIHSHIIHGASHFFHGQLIVLREHLKSCLAPYVPA